MEKIVLYDFDSSFYHFFCQYHYRHDVKVDAVSFLLYFRGITERMFEKMDGFHSYKFTMINEKTTILCENVALSLGELNFY